MITVERLTKRYGPFTAVDDVSFEAKAGLVTGFLGPNGAGKTTAMRIMSGLTPATSGTATVLGKPYAALPNPGRHVGLLLDASAQHAGRTGREVLTLGAILMGVGRQRVDEMVELVGLTVCACEVERIHVHVTREPRRELFAVPGEQVDDAAGHVGGREHLAELDGGERGALGGDDDGGAQRGSAGRRISRFGRFSVFSPATIRRQSASACRSSCA